MFKTISSIFIILFLSFSYISAEVNWVTDLDSAKHDSKVFKKPILVWVGINSHTRRPMICTEKAFDDLAKKIICVNLNPMQMTDAQKETYEVNDSNFSKFFYYDIDFKLLGSEANPPSAIIANVYAMLKSMEVKEDSEKVVKEDAATEEGAKALWEKASRLEIDEKYGSLVTVLKQIVTKFPTSSYADLAKLKIDKIESDPTIKAVVDAQKKEDNAYKILRSVDNMIKNNKKNDAIKKLESIVKDFPDTKAAEEAKRMLDKLSKE
jgi:TolA-binding protein